MYVNAPRLYKGDTNSALETCICPVFKAPQVASGVPLVIGIRAACAEIQTHKLRACDKGNSVVFGLL